MALLSAMICGLPFQVKRLTTILALMFALCSTADADVWTWTDRSGVAHFVDTNTTIYTWTDQAGNVYFSDSPDHESAERVALLWYSDGDLPENEKSNRQPSESRSADPNDTETERHAREQAEAYYCENAQKIYDSYRGAKGLYKTNKNGDRVILSEEEIAATLAETKVKVDELCY